VQLDLSQGTFGTKNTLARFFLKEEEEDKEDEQDDDVEQKSPLSYSRCRK
jgi:hypothetical protein